MISGVSDDYLTILSDDAKNVSFEKTCVELQNGRMVQLREKLSFSSGLDRLVGFQISNRNLLQYFPAQ